MRHGPALLALVLKLYLVLVLTQVALCQPAQSEQPNNGTVQLKPSASSSGPSSSSHRASSTSHSSSSSISTASQSSSSSSSHSSKSSSSSVDTSISLPVVSLSANSTPQSPLPSSTLPPDPSDSTTSPPTDTSAPTPANSEPAASQSDTTSAVLASTNSTNKVPIIAGVAGSVALIILMGISVMLYRRHKRARDRREWERTHESIADAVRQVTSPAPMRSVTPYAGSGAWSHSDYISAKGSGDTVTDPFIDNPVAHTSGEFSARPALRAVHSPTLRAVHSPTFSQAYSPYHAEDAAPFQVQDEVNSMESSIPVDTSHGSHGHAI